MPPGREALPRRGGAGTGNAGTGGSGSGADGSGGAGAGSAGAGLAGAGSAAAGADAAPALAAPGAGRRIVAAAWLGTAALVVTSIAGAIDPHPLGAVALVVALALFFGGIAAFFAAYVIAIGRSRESEIGIAAVFGLAGSAPRSVQRSLYGALAVQVVVAVSTAAARLHSVLAFGILAVMWGLGMIALWGARYGAFPPRRPAPERRRRGRR
jgi:hypothetical protein